MALVPNNYSRYRPLDSSKKEIRLLRVLPCTSPDDPLVCALVRTGLGQTPPYEALSYTWGKVNEETTVPIRLIFQETVEVDRLCDNEAIERLNGVISLDRPDQNTVDETFQIMPNLHAALRGVRIREKVDFIWVDMLCINQRDLAERSHQVSSMAEIFSGAASVHVWLGGDPEEESSELLSSDTDLDVYFQAYGDNYVGEFFDQFAAIKDQTYEGNFGATNMDRILNQVRANVETELEKFLALYCLWVLAKKGTYDKVKETFLGLTVRVVTHDTVVYHFLLTRLFFWANLRGDIPMETIVRQRLKDTFDDPTSPVGQLCLRLSRLFDLDYFHRVWVIQEVASNENVICQRGNVIVTWKVINAFFHSYTVFEIEHMLSVPKSLRMKTFQSIWLAIDDIRRKEFSVIRMLSNTIDLRATVPQDKIFAIQHLAADTAQSFPVDYSQSAAQTFCRFTKWVINQTNSLAIFLLNEKRVDYKVGSDLPTWVLPYGTRRATMEWGRDNGYEASSKRPAHVIDDQDYWRITVQGILLTTIDYVCPPKHITDGGDIWDTSASTIIERLWQSLLDMFARWKTTHRGLRHTETSDFYLEILFGALCSHYSFLRFSGDSNLLEVRAWLAAQLFEEGITKPSSRQADSLTDIITANQWLHGKPKECDVAADRSYYHFLLTTVMIRSTFVSQDGRLGICPLATKPGDIIAILDGGKVPFVLRPVPPPRGMSLKERVLRGEVFELIGGCWLHGRMQGEIYDEPLWEDKLHHDPLDADASTLDLRGRHFRRKTYRLRPFTIQ